MMASCATVAGATRVCAMQLLLQGDHRCPLPLLLLYVVPALLLTGSTSFLFFEGGNLDVIPEALDTAHLVGTLGLIALSSLLAFMLNLSELWCVRDVSALALTLAGALKTILLVVLTALVAGRTLSCRATLGSVMAVGGVATM